MQLGIKISVDLNSSCYSENPRQSDWVARELCKNMG